MKVHELAMTKLSNTSMEKIAEMLAFSRGGGGGGGDARAPSPAPTPTLEAFLLDKANDSIFNMLVEEKAVDEYNLQVVLKVLALSTLSEKSKAALGATAADRQRNIGHLVRLLVMSKT